VEEGGHGARSGDLEAQRHPYQIFRGTDMHFKTSLPFARTTIATFQTSLLSAVLSEATTCRAAAHESNVAHKFPKEKVTNNGSANLQASPGSSFTEMHGKRFLFLDVLSVACAMLVARFFSERRA
jgi:hypothetical protein